MLAGIGRQPILPDHELSVNEWQKGIGITKQLSQLHKLFHEHQVPTSAECDNAQKYSSEHTEVLMTQVCSARPRQEREGCLPVVSGLAGVELGGL